MFNFEIKKGVANIFSRYAELVLPKIVPPSIICENLEKL